MVTTEDPPEEGPPDPGDDQASDPEGGESEDMDFTPYQPPRADDHQMAQDDDGDEGNVSGVMHCWRAWPYNPRRHHFVYIKIAPYVSLPAEEKLY